MEAKRIDELEKRVAELEQRLEELEIAPALRLAWFLLPGSADDVQQYETWDDMGTDGIKDTTGESGMWCKPLVPTGSMPCCEWPPGWNVVGWSINDDRPS